MIEVGSIERTEKNGVIRLSGRISCSTDRRLDGQTLWWESSDFSRNAPGAAADPFVAALLLPAMRLGVPLRVDAPLSEGLGRRLPGIGTLVSRWWPDLRVTEVLTSGIHVGGEVPRRVGAFFSGGVDAFHTLIRNTEADVPEDRCITDLILVRGFDIHLERDEQLWQKALATARVAAENRRANVITVATNVRPLGWQFVGWERLHGAALASVALSLEGVINRAYIASSEHQSDEEPWGSHPQLDPLWSSDLVTIDYDGIGINRLEKIRSLSGSDLVMKHLRVCHSNPLGAYNCGKCEKCVRTMVELRVVRALDRCEVFSCPLTLRKVRRQHLPDPRFALACLEELERTKADPGLAEALRVSVQHSRRGESALAGWRRRGVSGMRRWMAGVDERLLGGGIRGTYRRLFRR